MGDEALDHGSVVGRAGVDHEARIGNELVMLDVEQGAYFGMDAVGTVIWEKLAAPVRVEDLCTALRQEYDVDADTCRREVLAFLETLRRHGLLELHPPLDR